MKGFTIFADDRPSLVTWSDPILESRSIDRGYSLRSAYRPRSSSQLADMLTQQPCRACGRVGSSLGRRWGVGSEPLQLGAVFYSALDHSCTCGLSLPIFVVLNDLLIEAGHDCIPADEALASAESLMPPRDLEQGLMRMSCVLHRGDVAEALMLAETLARRYPDRPECCFNAGYARQRMGDVAEALRHYRRALKLHPHLGDAWNNRALLLRQVGRTEEARFCEARARLARGEPAPPDPTTRVLGEATGRFGSLRVLENADVRALFIGTQCQGSVFRVADDDGPEPGPYAGSSFATGWLLAGCRYPAGRGLMIGLGCGAGAVSLLTDFPGIRLRVVEIDTQLIELALRHFPRLSRLHRQGRLEIINADARDVVSSLDERYDFALLDAFAGSTELPSLLEDPRFLFDLSASSELLLANAIFAMGDDTQRAWLAAFAAARRSVAAIYPTSGPEYWSKRLGNWILSTEHVVPPASYLPFAESSHFIVETMRDDFAIMCARAIVVPPPPEVCTGPSLHDPALGTLADAGASLG